MAGRIDEAPTNEGPSMKDRKPKDTGTPRNSAEPDTDLPRRAALRRLGRFAAVTPPAVALVLAARTKPANAAVISTDVTDGV